ncbi:hypothetical protein Bca101_043794 [Brassica carinata]
MDRTDRTWTTSPTGEDDPHRGYLAHGRGRPKPRSPRPWARTTNAVVTSPMGKDDPYLGHPANGNTRGEMKSAMEPMEVSLVVRMAGKAIAANERIAEWAVDV